MEEQVPEEVNTEARQLDLQAALDRLLKGLAAVRDVVVGQEQVVDQLAIAILAGGHVLIESPPGLGKTLLVRTLGRAFGLRLSRIQFTPDLMPADITGTFALVKGSHDFEVSATFQPGPVFAQIVLADEINRATPKTQSSLLEAMQEGTVTVVGQTYELPRPFLVFATQNPIEMEGTYQLPEAQLDRFFFKVSLEYPTQQMLEAIIQSTTGNDIPRPEALLDATQVLELQHWTRQVPISSDMKSFVARLVRSTQPELTGTSANVRRYVRYGASPRAAQSLVLAAKGRALMKGRFNVSEEDIRRVAQPVLRHRIRMNFEAEAAGLSVDGVIGELVADVRARR